MRHAARLSAIVLAVVIVTAIAAAACNGDDSGSATPGAYGPNGMMNGEGMGGRGGMMAASAPAGSIRVDLFNWSVVPAVTSTKAGSVTFWAIHDMGPDHMGTNGGATHDLQVMRKNADGSLTLVGQVQGLAMGEAKTLTLTLTPGEYELSCNVVEQINGELVSHYQKGMHTAFTVT